MCLKCDECQFTGLSKSLTGSFMTGETFWNLFIHNVTDVLKAFLGNTSITRSRNYAMTDEAVFSLCRAELCCAMLSCTMHC
jgi:hypothetical protein